MVRSACRSGERGLRADQVGGFFQGVQEAV